MPMNFSLGMPHCTAKCQSQDNVYFANTGAKIKKNLCFELGASFFCRLTYNCSKVFVDHYIFKLAVRLPDEPSFLELSLKNLHRKFVLYSASQILSEDFAKILWPSQNI